MIGELEGAGNFHLFVVVVVDVPLFRLGGVVGVFEVIHVFVGEVGRTVFALVFNSTCVLLFSGNLGIKC